MSTKRYDFREIYDVLEFMDDLNNQVDSMESAVNDASLRILKTEEDPKRREAIHHLMSVFKNEIIEIKQFIKDDYE